MDTKTGEILYYDLRPVYRRTSSIATACIVECVATGKYLSGSGGPAYALSPEIVQALDRAHNGGDARMVVDQESWDMALSALILVTAGSGPGPRVVDSEALDAASAALARMSRDG